MWQLYVLAALSGWCGNEPRPLPKGGGKPGGGGGDPGDPPPGCLACGPGIGAIAGLVAYVVLGQGETGFLAAAVIGYLGGKAGGIAVNVITGMRG